MAEPGSRPVPAGRASVGDHYQNLNKVSEALRGYGQGLQTLAVLAGMLALAGGLLLAGYVSAYSGIAVVFAGLVFAMGWHWAGTLCSGMGEGLLALSDMASNTHKLVERSSQQ